VREGGNSGDRRICRVVAALEGMAWRLSGFDGGEKDNASPALGCVGGGRC